MKLTSTPSFLTPKLATPSKGEEQGKVASTAEREKVFACKPPRSPHFCMQHLLHSNYEFLGLKNQQELQQNCTKN